MAAKASETGPPASSETNAGQPTKEEVQTGFGDAVRALRSDAELTQEQLAASSEMHVTYISQIERGLKNVSLFNLYRIASALEISPARLLEEAARHQAGSVKHSAGR
ncbi:MULTISPECIES: helix-turn-helix domain-containing protein [Variovorax]|uniref:helix-turn-helix domain-containing protein n=1 Tax=Variovorax TaxID=34072 RepID=UPI00285A977B|nr:helix-turn-helix transcriptional regulator [Variovorax sp. 3319]MDR6890032.1 transcriptional regulator with XRE-family HTH domain [Variovorax sp. 3319]